MNFLLVGGQHRIGGSRKISGNWKVTKQSQQRKIESKCHRSRRSQSAIPGCWGHWWRVLLFCVLIYSAEWQKGIKSQIKRVRRSEREILLHLMVHSPYTLSSKSYTRLRAWVRNPGLPCGSKLMWLGPSSDMLLVASAGRGLDIKGGFNPTIPAVLWVFQESA